LQNNCGALLSSIWIPVCAALLGSSFALESRCNSKEQV
jgi:hypothetical protein